MNEAIDSFHNHAASLLQQRGVKRAAVQMSDADEGCKLINLAAVERWYEDCLALLRAYFSVDS